MNKITCKHFNGRTSLLLILQLVLFSFAVSASNVDGRPFITLTCPADITINPDPGLCIAYLDFNSLVWNSDVPYASAVFEPGPGFPFEYGNTTVSLTVTDLAGNVAVCTFLVTVEPNTYTLVCDDLVPVYLGANCQREVTPFLILAGGPYDCEEEYNVSIFNPASGNYEGNLVDTSFIGDTWTVTVESNYSGNYCWSTILVLPDSISQEIVCPPNTTILCHEPYTPDHVGFAQVETCLDPANYDITFTELRSNSYCNGDEIAFIVQRQWKVTNIYDISSTCQQTITAMRVGLDDLVFPPNYDGIAHPTLACNDTLSYEILADTSNAGVPLINGYYPGGVACSMVFFVSDSVRHICGQEYKILREWTAFDICTDEMITYIQTIIIEDAQGPAFEVPSLLTASNQSDCGQLVALPPIQLEHECSGFDVEIWTPWDTLHSDGGILFVPVSVGAHNIIYVATDVCGNVGKDTSLLTFNASVIAACPADDTVTCSFYQENLQAALEIGDLSVLQPFGNPVLNANCSALPVAESAYINLDSCFQGNIVRTMTVEANGQQHACEQHIEVVKISDFTVEFPADITIFCSPNDPDLGEPEIHGGDCENIQVSYTDEIFTPDPDACYKIVRTWVVSNPCVAGAMLDDEVVEKPESQLGLSFPLCDLDGDGDCDDYTFRDSWNDSIQPGETDAWQATGFDSDTDADPWDGYMVYKQTIKVHDNKKPVFLNCNLPIVCTTEANCTAGILLPTPPIDDCSPNLDVVAQIRINGAWAVGFGPHQNLSPGSYEVRYVAKDLCNNQSDCETTLTVTDCLPPVAVCNSTTELNILQNGTVSVNAELLNEGSYDECGGPVEFSYSAIVSDDTRTFTCDDLGLSTLVLWVTDTLGNQSQCNAEIEIQDFDNNCGFVDTIGYEGFITTELDDGVSSVEVEFQLSSVITDSDGAFLIPDLFPLPLLVTPSKNTGFTNGVTTFDIVILTKHILGEQPLDSPYKLIAADVNKSGTVTTFDAVGIRQLVLNIVTAFPSNTSWRFVPKDYQFPDPENPFDPPFPESATIDAAYSGGDIDFVGIKIGDLNGSAMANILGEPDERNMNGAFAFSLANFPVKAGETFTLPFYQENIPVYGWQFALGFDHARIEFQDVVPGFAGIEHFGLQEAVAGIIRASWNDYYPSNRAGQTAFSLVFKAKKDGKPSDWLHLDNEAMANEAYTATLERKGVQLMFNDDAPTLLAARFFPARPNPFSDEVVLPIFLPESGMVRLALSDISGRKLVDKTIFLEMGYQVLPIKSLELPGSGLYIYELQTNAGGSVGKIVLKE